MMITGSDIEKHFLVIPETGEVFRNRKPSEKLKLAGYIKPGSRSSGGGYRLVAISMGDRKYKAIQVHRLVWCWVHGEWPKSALDHINGDRADNRIANLRLADSHQNRLNKGRQTNNKSGYKWVSKYQNKWRAEVGYRENGIKKRFRKLFSTPDEAYEAACAFALSAHGKFYNPGKIG